MQKTTANHTSLIAMIVLSISSLLLGDDGKSLSHTASTNTPIFDATESWKNNRERTSKLSGEVEIFQASWTDHIDVPVQSDEITEKDVTAPPTPVKTERKTGNFTRIESAQVTFKVDAINHKLWCKWTLKEPVKWIDSETKSIMLTDHATSISSVVTETDYIHHQAGAKVVISDAGLSSEVATFDAENHKDNANYRGMILRDTADDGRRHMERSFVFQPLSMLQIGGQSMDGYLENAKQLLQPVGTVTVSTLANDPNGYSLSSLFRRSATDTNPLVVETHWIATSGVTIPSHLPSVLKEHFTNDANKPPFLVANWTWDEAFLKQGIALPSSYDVVIRSGEMNERVEFERNITVKVWDINPEFNQDDFSVWALDPRVGDVIHDREHKTFSYVADNHEILPMKGRVEHPPPSSMPSYYLMLANGLLLLIAMVFLFWRRRKRCDLPSGV